MTRGNWEQATTLRPDNECPRCGDDRLTERIAHPDPTCSYALMYCNLCSLTWRVVLPAKGSNAV